MHDWKTTPLFKSPFKSSAFQKAKSPASFYYSDRFFESLPLLFHLSAFFPSLALPFFYYYDYAQPFIPFQISCMNSGEGGKKKTLSLASRPAAGNTMTRARLTRGEGPGAPVWEPRLELATSTLHAEQGACAVVNIHKGRIKWRTRPFPPGCWGGVELRMGWGMRDIRGGMAARGAPHADQCLEDLGQRERKDLEGTWRSPWLRDSQSASARPPPRCAAWAPMQAPGVGAAMRPEQLGRAASALRAACVSCGFRPGRRACPPGAGAAPCKRAQSTVLAAARLARS